MNIKNILLAAALLATGLTSATAQTKYVGGDISLLPKYETAGAQYYASDGTAIDAPLTYFAQQGMNAMRVRLFVDPSKQTGSDIDANACQDLETVKALGKRIKDAGYSLMLDFHYSDTWADPSKQWTPADWASLTDAELATRIYDYTLDVLQQMKAAGAAPDFIQTGNEISYGMLWGTRAAATGNFTNRCYPSSDAACWDRFANLLTQAIKACREECPAAKVLLHTERVSTSQQNDNKNYSTLQAFYDKMKSYGIDYDIIGLSYYPYFHGPLTELEGAISMLESRFADKDIMLVEFGYPYKWAVGGTTYDYTATYPYSDEGQRAFTADAIEMLNKHASVKGLFWWWMEYNAKGTSLTGWYNAPLFDSTTGRATSALYEMKNFLKDQAGINTVSTDRKTMDDAWYTPAGIRLSAPTQRGLYLHQGKAVVVR